MLVCAVFITISSRVASVTVAPGIPAESGLVTVPIAGIIAVRITHVM